MGIFSMIVKTAIETAKLPLVMAKDAFTLGNFGEGCDTPKQLEEIKRAAEDKDV